MFYVTMIEESRKDNLDNIGKNNFNRAGNKNLIGYSR